MNTDVSCSILADLPAVRILQNYVPYQRSQFSLLAKLLVTAPQLPVESLAEEAHHTDTIWTNSLSEETGKARPRTLWRDMWVTSCWMLIRLEGRPSESQLNISPKIKISFFPRTLTTTQDQILRFFHSHFTMKMIVTHIWSNTLVPRSQDRWHVAVRACPQLHAAAQQRAAVAQPSPHPPHTPPSELYDQYVVFQQRLVRLCHYSSFVRCAPIQSDRMCEMFWFYLGNNLEKHQITLEVEQILIRAIMRAHLPSYL